MLNDKCAKNHLKMRSFDRLKELLKFVEKTKKTSDKNLFWPWKELNPRPHAYK